MKIGITLIVTSCLIAALETQYFLQQYGWHYWAYNQAEKFWDTLSVIVHVIGLIFLCKGFKK